MTEFKYIYENNNTLKEIKIAIGLEIAYQLKELNDTINLMMNNGLTINIQK